MHTTMLHELPEGLANDSTPKRQRVRLLGKNRQYKWVAIKIEWATELLKEQWQ
jgi:hypothetical protein